MGSLGRRHLQPELMDQPGLDGVAHRQALVGLSRINYLSASASSFFRPLVNLQRQLGLDRLRILDVASGGGDVPLRLWHRADRLGLDWRIAGCDVSPTAVEYAQRQAFQADAPLRFFVHDVLNGPALPGDYDAVICSLFLHHLEDHQAVALLRALTGQGTRQPRLVLVNDLNRCRTGLILAYLVTQVLTRSTIVHADGPASVRAAFTPQEALQLAREAGLTEATIRRCWPWRWLLEWRRPCP
ncbi:MAG: methyltransferase domain-containing protein [Gemmataceae bacterium]